MNVEDSNSVPAPQGGSMDQIEDQGDRRQGAVADGDSAGERSPPAEGLPRREPRRPRSRARPGSPDSSPGSVEARGAPQEAGAAGSTVHAPAAPVASGDGPVPDGTSQDFAGADGPAASTDGAGDSGRPRSRLNRRRSRGGSRRGAQARAGGGEGDPGNGSTDDPAHEGTGATDEKGEGEPAKADPVPFFARGSWLGLSAAPQRPAPRPQRVDDDSSKLHKILADAGIGSRRDMEELILAGRVSVNGQPAHVGQRVGPDDQVRVNGRPLNRRRVPLPTRVVLYHKPPGEICTRDDPGRRPRVFDQLPRLRGARWVGVGRLDLNSEGLLIFTTSGELANRLMHPRYGWEREYAVRILGRVDDEAKARLLAGVPLEDGPAALLELDDIGGDGANHWYRVAIAEGRNREVRRLFEAVGLTVSRLVRVRFGPVALPPRLSRGRWVELGDQDVRRLGRMVREAANGAAPGARPAAGSQGRPADGPGGPRDAGESLFEAGGDDGEFEPSNGTEVRSGATETGPADGGSESGEGGRGRSRRRRGAARGERVAGFEGAEPTTSGARSPRTPGPSAQEAIHDGRDEGAARAADLDDEDRVSHVVGVQGDADSDAPSGTLSDADAWAQASAGTRADLDDGFGPTDLADDEGDGAGSGEIGGEAAGEAVAGMPDDPDAPPVTSPVPTRKPRRATGPRQAVLPDRRPGLPSYAGRAWIAGGPDPRHYGQEDDFDEPVDEHEDDGQLVMIKDLRKAGADPDVRPVARGVNVEDDEWQPSSDSAHLEGITRSVKKDSRHQRFGGDTGFAAKGGFPRAGGAGGGAGRLRQGRQKPGGGRVIGVMSGYAAGGASAGGGAQGPGGHGFGVPGSKRRRGAKQPGAGAGGGVGKGPGAPFGGKGGGRRRPPGGAQGGPAGGPQGGPAGSGGHGNAGQGAGQGRGPGRRRRGPGKQGGHGSGGQGGAGQG
jgi:23S rRNA pseudouridine2605 synthase